MNKNLEIVYLPVEALTPYEKNARQHKAVDVAVIKKSIEEFGFDDPIGIWSDKNIIVEGHGRLLAAKELGMTEVPCIRLDHLTDEQRKAYALTHNRSAELSSWDFDTLDEELKALEDEFDLSALGFEELLPEEETEAKDDNFEENDYLSENPESKFGDIFVLGRHHLLCGDSTNLENLKNFMGDVKADLLLTDPPYNVNYEGEAGTIQNDNMPNEKYGEFLTKAFTCADYFMKPGASFYVWFADKKAYWVQGAMLDVKWEVRQMPIWNKSSFTLTGSNYQVKHEPCFYGWKSGAPCYFIDDRSQSTVWDFDKPRVNDLHPTMKPLELFGYLITNSSRKGDVVLDLFGGSGTTLIASEELGRTCYMVEKEPKYSDVIVKRYLRYTGSKEGCYMIRNGEKQELPQEFLSILDF